MASRYVTRDLPALLESYSPLRQIEDGLSPGLTDGGEPESKNKERGALGSNELESASFSELVETGEGWLGTTNRLWRRAKISANYLVLTGVLPGATI